MVTKWKKVHTIEVSVQNVPKEFNFLDMFEDIGACFSYQNNERTRLIIWEHFKQPLYGYIELEEIK